MKSRENIKRLIIGAGNILLSDEGIGIHIIKELENDASFNDGTNAITEYVDIGTSSIDISAYLSEDTEKIVIIDSIISSDFTAGTVFKLTIEDLRKKQAKSFSLHQMELVDSLKLLSMTGRLPQILIIGVVPNDTDSFSLDLSFEMKSKLPQIMDKVKKEILDFFNKNA